MREGWRRTTLGEVCGGGGSYGLTASAAEAAVGPKFLRTTDMIDGNINWESVPFCELDPGRVDRYSVVPGDLVISRTGANAGATAFVSTAPQKAVFAGYLVRFRADLELADPRFVGYAVTSASWRDYVENTRTGSAQPQFNANLMAAFEFDLPPLPEQRRIASVLGALDDLIDTNERLAADLDRFGRSHLDLSCKGGMDFAFLGESTEGWSVISMDEAASIIETGRRPKGGVSGISQGTPSLGAESIKGLAHFDMRKLKYVPTAFAEKMSRGVLESRDVLVYKDGGKPGDFRPHVAMLGDGFPFEEMVINEHVYRVRASQPLSEPYLYFWLSSEPALDFMRMVGTGAAIPGLNSKAFKSIPVGVPSPRILGELLPVLDSLVAGALGCAKEAMTLRSQRDELLPLLLSGAVSPGEVTAAS